MKQNGYFIGRLHTQALQYCLYALQWKHMPTTCADTPRAKHSQIFQGSASFYGVFLKGSFVPVRNGSLHVMWYLVARYSTPVIILSRNIWKEWKFVISILPIPS